MKHGCPDCGKRFDFEMCGWICPYCGKVVLHSEEKKAEATEALEKQLRKIQRKNQVKAMAAESKRQNAAKLKGALVFFVILFGGAFGLRLWEYLKEKQDAPQTITEQQRQWGEEIAIEPFVVQINGAAWADTLPDFPEEVTPPVGGRYLAVAYELEGGASHGSLAVQEVMWSCLDTGEDFLLPLVVSQVSGSQSVRDVLYDMDIRSDFDDGQGYLLFLVREDTDLKQLSLRIYSGEPSGHLAMAQNNAQVCHEVLLKEQEVAQ